MLTHITASNIATPMVHTAMPGDPAPLVTAAFAKATVNTSADTITESSVAMLLHG